RFSPVPSQRIHESQAGACSSTSGKTDKKIVGSRAGIDHQGVLMTATSPFSLAGKKGLILGVANDRSIAWGCTELFRALGAEVVATCLNDKARKYVQPLTDKVGVDLLNCDVEQPD